MGRRAVTLLLAVCLLGSAAAECISPTTGLPIPEEPGMPVVVSIGHTPARSTWGAKQADVVYESLLHRNGSTRFSFLFHDALVNGQDVQAGPVRSVRTSHVLLAEEWSAALVYGAGVGGNAHAAIGLRELQSPNCALGTSRWKRYGTRLWPQPGRRAKAPDNLSADVSGIYTIYKEETHPESQGFVFDDELKVGWNRAESILLNWGKEGFTSQFEYQEGRYLYFVDSRPAMSYLNAQDLQEEQMHFANVVVQMVDYEWHELHDWMPVMPRAGEGRAWVFREGRVLQGIWKKEDGKTLLLDEAGTPLFLSRGNTFWAHFPEDRDGFSWK